MQKKHQQIAAGKDTVLEQIGTVTLPLLNIRRALLEEVPLWLISGGNTGHSAALEPVNMDVHAFRLTCSSCPLQF